MAPDQAQFEQDLSRADFLEGAARRRWRFVGIDWPHVTFAARARDELEFGFRFENSGYPQQSSTAQLWCLERDAAPLPEEWPTGNEIFNSVFNPGWKGGTALYHPYDRLSREGHGDWPNQYPHLIWDTSGSFVQYLSEIHRLLNGRGYHGKS